MTTREDILVVVKKHIMDISEDLTEQQIDPVVVHERSWDQ